jgi:hypothetical protein
MALLNDPPGGVMATRSADIAAAINRAALTHHQLLHDAGSRLHGADQ